MSKILKFSERLLFIFLFVFASSFQRKTFCSKSGLAFVKIIFINTVKGKKIVLNDSIYTNAFEEKYNITKLRYYVSNLELGMSNNFYKEKNSYHLIDESKPESQVINLSMPEGTYNSLEFLLGVDSLHNVSGAQTGELDPANDMFWTWNNGYVMAKMEGNSPDSKLVNNKYEFHIGGFSGPFNVLKKVHLSFPENSIQFNAGKPYTIIINADINTWWQSPNDIKIAEHANVTSPGINAKNISENYVKMFHVEKIIAE